LLWQTPPPGAELLGIPFRRGQGTGVAEAAAFLDNSSRDATPFSVDCETETAEFGECYWIAVTRLDSSRRNDALDSSRLVPQAAATLDVGPFTLDSNAVVTGLPAGYGGPLREGDRIVSIGGRAVGSAADLQTYLRSVRGGGTTALMVQRGSNRVRIETRLTVPHREVVSTGRIKAEYLPEGRELVLISRGVAELRVDLPVAWAPVSVNWNGLAPVRIERAGCHVFRQAATVQVAPCN
jgi:hypothetical protein